MNFSHSRPSKHFLLPLVLVAVATISSAQQPAATYTHGNLSVTIPYHSAGDGSGRLVSEILDPEDHILGRVEGSVDIVKGDGAWRQVIRPEKPISFEDMVWLRFRYRFEHSGGDNLPAIHGIESISEILRRPAVRIIGDTRYLAGSEAEVRVIVSDANNNDISEPGTIHIDLLRPKHKPLPLFSGQLDHRGTVGAQLRFPAGLTGNLDLHYIADTPIGSAEYTQPVQLDDAASILLTTEKPLYQPGQTIHIRALALDHADNKAVPGRKLTFVVEDSRGNKVFKKATETDKFGVAFAEFSLADEVNFGTYHLHALMGDASAPSSTAEVALNVERYVLPKFKVAVEFTGKRDYRPGDHVTGTVRANYFFGKPVAHADITVKASGMDVAVFEAASTTGKTDDEGAYHFDLKLPNYFAGRPLSQGAARALIEATVKDSAAHAETRGEPITISQASLLITAVPEGGALVPNVENQVYVLSSYPDGRPAGTSLKVHIAGGRDQQVSTDSSGVAVVRIKPGSGVESLHVEADDHHGNRSSSDVKLQTRSGSDQILLRANRAIFKAGERIDLKLLSTRGRGTAYVDIVRNGQTILTRDVDLENGQADLSLPVTPEMAGTLDIDAYVFGRDAQPVADHRLVFVQPADELKIDATADSAVYKPGSDARIHFHVTNCRGQGISAALGLQVIDEAVFALAEKQPGFAKVFFYLEQEVMQPRYEIHSLSMESAIEPIESSQQQDLAARALFAATELAHPTRLDTEFGRSLPQEKYAEYEQRYRDVFIDQARQLAAKLTRKLEKPNDSVDMMKAFADITAENEVRSQDAWGIPLRLEPAGSGGWTPARTRFYLIRSAGPDRQFNSADDLTVYIEERSGGIVNQPNRGSSFDLKIEHDRGPFNDRAEITGTVVDPSGAFVSGATIQLHQLSGLGKVVDTRTARADAGGRFTLAGLAAGHYRAEISSPGFNSVVREFSLEARDRALVSALLMVGSVSQAVMLQAVGGPIRSVMDMVGVVSGLATAATPATPAPMMLAEQTNGATVPLHLRSFTVLQKLEKPTEGPHVRSYFPEALYINPEIITDAGGDASISIPVADSITTWRMAMVASTQAGALGSGTSSLKVFQDFFVDLDLPVTLTQGDRVSIPVAVYNYSGKAGDVSLELQPEDWFSLDNDTANKTLAVGQDHVGASQFTFTARRIGKFKLTLSAHMDGRDDIVVREIEVIPNGREQNLVFNGRLEGAVEHALNFPSNSIADATSVLVRLYPGPLSQIIEGMDSILRMPGGCFEQTSSSTYPNVLALDYMKHTKKLTPEVHAKAEGYIANGYQRLLTFEVPGGGFSWFGQAPANKILTAYGLMEFNDMSKVSDVDPRVIERTRAWLASQQQPDGSWQADPSLINEGATDRYNSNLLRITAYIAWSLVNTGDHGAAVERAKRFIQSHRGERPDTYTLAIIANFAAGYGEDREFTRQSMQALLDARSESGDQVSWTAEETGVYSTGASAAIETTGLATQALLKWGQASETVRKALNFISSKKEASGNWGTTQATIMALRSLLLASQIGTADIRGAVEVMLNGKPVETLTLTPENNDLLHQFVVKGIDAEKHNVVELKFEGAGGLAYQVVGRYFTPWEEKRPVDPLSIDVVYDRTKLALGDTATSTVTIRNNLSKTANMVMIDLGIPPGFDLLSEDLQSFQEKHSGDRPGSLEKFSLTASQAILYFNALSPRETVTLKYRLRAKYPIRARTFQSRVYEYYDPAVSSTAHPVQLEVVEQ